MVWSSAPRKIAIIKATSTLRMAGLGVSGGFRVVTENLQAMIDPQGHGERGCSPV
jgi:hypothetical protein